MDRETNSSSPAGTVNWKLLLSLGAGRRQAFPTSAILAIRHTTPSKHSDDSERHEASESTQQRVDQASRRYRCALHTFATVCHLPNLLDTNMSGGGECRGAVSHILIIVVTDVHPDDSCCLFESA